MHMTRSMHMPRSMCTVVRDATAGSAAMQCMKAKYLKHMGVRDQRLAGRFTHLQAISAVQVRAMRLQFDAWGTPGVSERWMSSSNSNVGSAELGSDKVDILAGQTLGGTSLLNGVQWTVPDYSVRSL